MAYGFMEIALTPSVHAAQVEMGADHLWTPFRGHRESDRFTEQEAGFIAQRDSFYIGSVSQSGWPYVQHRGGPAGFLKVIDPQTLAFADYRGNRQYISTGNFLANGKACLILVDYPRRARLKIYGEVEKLGPEDDPALRHSVTDADYGARIERIFRLRLKAFDWNCPQHITPRFTEAEVVASVQPLHEAIARLEQENAALRARLGEAGPPPG